MTVEQAPIDSPTEWVRNHIETYIATNGEVGHDWQGTPTLLLTVKGRSSGKLYRTALIYGRNGDDYVVVASKGGAPEHPNWYLNLTANPDVEVQVKADRFKATARTANAEERPALWEMMAKVFPTYKSFQTKTDREIPVVILTPGERLG